MPINKNMMAAMMKEYGVKKGKEVYYATEMKQKMMKDKIASKKKK